ncbi:hypothetical protein CHLNCDRAFT_135831 [Chlorella variabilis]|uniref:Methyltransferase type 11 domain-containing protein n=1 Tax=Chlorella variabilis TaxID=554065 RepID=E1ZJ36_CHLVA|nr:hypothetical protein CHLNCDRAFT_135831 [Chlorella variabilis]EFN54437.1 hypothetical protein CHLNCDRAFT_135831 [Chlorella variabilis]|eukprot:XP_005846539.1 hypothetical protein CHLNCDRAFT_135831 [Chlorella variabilis]
MALVSTATTSGGNGAAPPPAVREVLDRRQRQKLSAGDDREFYSVPRLVHHLDAGFRAQLTQLYRQRIPEGGDVLDLCSSWVSHLPPERKYGRVVGHGMNAAELGRNAQLSEFFVRDLNRQPSGWAFADESFDAVLCCASCQYLEQPEAVFAEMRRVLKPGGVAIVAFSNRMFYEKAIAAWRDNTDYGRCVLVKSYFAAAGGFSEPEVVKRVELPAQATGLVQQVQMWGERLFSGGSSDPFFAVVAHKLGTE